MSTSISEPTLINILKNELRKNRHLVDALQDNVIALQEQADQARAEIVAHLSLCKEIEQAIDAMEESK